MKTAHATAPETNLTVSFLWAFDSDLGWIAVETDGHEVTGLVFGHPDAASAIAAFGPRRNAVLESPPPTVLDWQQTLQRYAAGQVVDIGEVPVRVAPANTFTGAVHRMCREIPRGSVMTYRDLAVQAGSPRASRAVGNVMRTNRVPLLIPCHRVVGTSGPGGYSAGGGTQTKQRLLEMEKGRGRID